MTFVRLLSFGGAQLVQSATRFKAMLATTALELQVWSRITAFPSQINLGPVLLFFFIYFFSFFYFLNLIFWMGRGEKDSCRDERPSRFQSLARPCSIFALWLLPLALPLASFGVYTVDYHLHRKCEKWTLLTRRSATFHGLICPVEAFHHLYMAG